MSRWLTLAEGSAIDTQTLTDNMTKPDKTPDLQPEGAFCHVLSNCQAQSGEDVRAPQRDDMRHYIAINGHPKTWAGNIVSFEQWRRYGNGGDEC